MKKKIIIIIILVFLVSFAGRNVYERALGRSDGDGQRKFSAENFRGESVNIAAGQNIIKTELSFTSTQEATVYDLMDALRTKEEITFTEKNYIGMGKFIDSINGIQGNGDKNWIYYVNGVKATVGVSNYKLKPGDVVSWKYEKVY